MNAPSLLRMIREGRELSRIAQNIVVKCPSTVEGLKACKALSDGGIRVNMTLCFQPLQALMVAKAGAFLVSPFIGRLDDVATSGIDLICLSIHQDFVDPSPEYRRQQIDHTLKCIEIAYELGVPCIRLNSGRWNTIASFDDLMTARGEEPILPGYTENDGFKWCIDCIEECLPKAAQCGVVLALVAGLVFMLAAGNNQFGVVVAGLMGFVAATLWMIGCVAIGVRVGLAHDD